MFEFEVLIGLTAFGVVCVAIVEILEKCEHRHADAEQEARRPRQMAS